MRDRIDELSASPVGERVVVALVTFTDEASLADYGRRHELGFTLLRDADRSAYRAFGLGRGKLTRVWGLRAARRYVGILRRNRRPGRPGVRDLHRPTEDTRQLGGDFVIDPDGRLAWGHWGEGPDDRPTVDALVAAARAAGERP